MNFPFFSSFSFVLLSLNSPQEGGGGFFAWVPGVGGAQKKFFWGGGGGGPPAFMGTVGPPRGERGVAGGKVV